MRLTRRSVRMVARARRAGVRLAVVLLLLGVPGTHGADAACPERAPCKGCGCAGGPGYRGPDGRCVSFRELAKVCGDPPATRCVFENAPGTGANRDCVQKPAGSASPPPAVPAAPAR